MLQRKSRISEKIVFLGSLSEIPGATSADSFPSSRVLWEDSTGSRIPHFLGVECGRDHKKGQIVLSISSSFLRTVVGIWQMLY